MYRPKSNFDIEGTAFGLNIRVRIAVEADDANAHPAITQDSTAVVDVQNMQTMFVRAVSHTLAQLQGMEIAGTNPFRAPATEVPAQTGSARVIDMSAFKKSLRDADEGTGD